ncbi:MAG: hypothetical protein KBI35_05120 [Ruminococcus sp.]|nr:hypothetical protein [Ruminococcus sp.]MBP8593788.1 hypothetical protein [Ruminococcus sp.]
MSNDYIGQFRGEEIDELLETVSTNVYTKAQIDSALSGKVNTAPGMGLSQESFTTEEKAKLAELENYDDTAVKAQCKALAKAGVKNELSTENFSVYRGNGITVTRNSDGSLTINGTQLESSAFIYPMGIEATLGQKFVGRTVTITGTPQGYGQDKCIARIYQYNGTNHLNDNGSGATGTITSPDAKFDIRIFPGQTFDNVTIYPMIRDASITDPDYEPYAPSNRQLYEMILSLIN